MPGKKKTAQDKKAERERHEKLAKIGSLNKKITEEKEKAQKEEIRLMTAIQLIDGCIGATVESKRMITEGHPQVLITKATVEEKAQKILESKRALSPSLKAENEELQQASKSTAVLVNTLRQWLADIQKIMGRMSPAVLMLSDFVTEINLIATAIKEAEEELSELTDSKPQEESANIDVVAERMIAAMTDAQQRADKTKSDVDELTKKIDGAKSASEAIEIWAQRVSHYVVTVAPGEAKQNFIAQIAEENARLAKKQRETIPVINAAYKMMLNQDMAAEHDGAFKILRESIHSLEPSQFTAKFIINFRERIKGDAGKLRENYSRLCEVCSVRCVINGRFEVTRLLDAYPGYDAKGIGDDEKLPQYLNALQLRAQLELRDQTKRETRAQLARQYGSDGIYARYCQQFPAWRESDPSVSFTQIFEEARYGLVSVNAQQRLLNHFIAQVNQSIEYCKVTYPLPPAQEFYVRQDIMSRFHRTDPMNTLVARLFFAEGDFFAAGPAEVKTASAPVVMRRLTTEAISGYIGQIQKVPQVLEAIQKQ